VNFKSSTAPPREIIQNSFSPRVVNFQSSQKIIKTREVSLLTWFNISELASTEVEINLVSIAAIFCAELAQKRFGKKKSDFGLLKLQF
jgi:hypothetical protein